MEGWCICAKIPQIENRTRVLVLRHIHEAQKSTNTARIAALALSRTEILDWVPLNPPDVDAWVKGHGRVWLVWPGGSTAAAGSAPPDALLVLDGTWRQARKILHTHTSLLHLPRLELPPPAAGTRRLREAPNAEARSTLEAIAGALTLVEAPEIGDQLEALSAVHVEQVLKARGMF